MKSEYPNGGRVLPKTVGAITTAMPLSTIKHHASVLTDEHSAWLSTRLAIRCAVFRIVLVVMTLAHRHKVFTARAFRFMAQVRDR